MNGPRGLLLVDDNARDREMAIEALRENRLGSEVTALADGADALDYLYRRGAFSNRIAVDPAVILLDLKMSKLDGLEVLRIIKEDESLKHIPVVVMTSSREEQDVFRSYQLGVNAYVVKPLDFHQFTEAMRAVGAFWILLNEPPRRAPAKGGNSHA